MSYIFIIIFIIEIISWIVMGVVLKKLYAKTDYLFAKDNLGHRIHINITQLIFFIGSSGGILLWGCLIGFIIGVFASDFTSLIYSFYVSSLISLLPSILGISKAYKIDKRLSNI